MSKGIDVEDYMQQAREIAPAFMADIAAGILAGVVFFCVGEPGGWDDFDLAGESAFQDLLSEQFGDVSEKVEPSATSTPKAQGGPYRVYVGKPISRKDAQAAPSATSTPKAQDGPHGVSVGKPPTEYQQWIHDPRKQAQS